MQRIRNVAKATRVRTGVVVGALAALLWLPSSARSTEPAAVVSNLGAAAQPLPIAPRPPELKGIDAEIERILRDWRIPGLSLSIVKDGKVILAKGYGVRDLESGAPMTADTLFPIQSETKAFTAFSAALLADEGKLSLDAPVATYVPGFRLNEAVASQEVTLRDLLSHRSGMSSYGWLWLNNNELSRKDSMARMPYLPLAAPIRTEWRYANMGYVASGQAVENVSGVPWERFVETRILQPLGMNRTTFSAADANADPNHIMGSVYRNGRYVAVPMQGTTPMTNSTGGLYSTAIDMTQWIAFQLGEGELGGRRLISREMLKQTWTPQMFTRRPFPSSELSNATYGLGWFVESYRGETMVEHGGGHWGVSSVVGMLPERKLGLSIFVNQSSDLPVYLMLQIFDRFTGKGRRDWAHDMLAEQKDWEAQQQAKEADPDKGRIAGAPASHPLDAYVGVYEHPGFGKVEVTLEDGVLAARANGDASRLRHWHYDVFRPTATEFRNIWAMIEDLKVQFLTGYDGQVEALRLTGTPDGVVFRRAAPAKAG